MFFGCHSFGFPFFFGFARVGVRVLGWPYCLGLFVCYVWCCQPRTTGYVDALFLVSLTMVFLGYVAGSGQSTHLTCGARLLCCMFCAELHVVSMESCANLSTVSTYIFCFVSAYFFPSR